MSGKSRSHVLALDLGTSQIRLAACNAQGQAETICEYPSLVLVSRPPQRVVAVGAQAAGVADGSLPVGVEALRPLKVGVIAALDPVVALIRAALNELMGGEGVFAGLRSKPRVLVGLRATATDVERALVMQALHAVGLRQAVLLPITLAAALGAELPINANRPTCVCDLGAGKVEAAVLRGGEVQMARAWALGGDWLDHSVMRSVRRRRGHQITPAMAEQARFASGEVSLVPPAQPGGRPGTGPLRRRRMGTGPLMQRVTAGGSFTEAHAGAHSLSGLPEFNSEDMRVGLQEGVRPLLDQLLWFWEDMPYDVREAVSDDGLVLTGGLALLPGLADTLAHMLQVEVRVAPDPAAATLRGLAELTAQPSAWTTPWRPVWEDTP